MEIYKKLLKLQQAVKGLAKDKKGNNYTYVTGNKLLSFIKPLMDENHLILKQEVLSIDNERMDYKTGIGTQYEKPKSEILTKVMMRFTWIDCETGEKDENLFGANGQNEWEKGLGSALTYAERYFILKYFHIATDEDDIDNPDRKPEETPDVKHLVNNAKTPSTPIDIDRLKTRLESCSNLESLASTYKGFTPLEQKATKAIAISLKESLTKKTA
ncbi:ERF family protein [Seonamhaeicola sp.]|uniref:ERF family protein n=1 Tax=Seonamhaeicola sp. TaxID=1912245 RepID=UPI0035636FE6